MAGCECFATSPTTAEPARRLTTAALGVWLAAAAVRAEDASTKAICKVMEENLAACYAEDLPRQMKTMSRETPDSEQLIRATLKEWAAADTSTHLIEIKGLKRSDSLHAPFRLPYATLIFVQQMTKSVRAAGSEAPSDLSRMFGLDQARPLVGFESLWKRERRKWRNVAAMAAATCLSDRSDE